jgi:acetyl esterase/lipase
MKHGQEILGVDTSKMATGGSSAGANLAAIMCQRAVTRGSPTFSLQLLSVPVMDNTADTTNNASWKENQHSPALPAPKMLWYRNQGIFASSRLTGQTNLPPRSRRYRPSR